MTHQWDEFSKSFAEPVPRRESLRRLGFVLAGAVLSPLGLGSAWAAGKAAPKGGAKTDPCKSFCNQCPKSQRSQCLAACQGCADAGGHLCGSCGGFGCCSSEHACCGNYCADLDSDVHNCGGCGNVCWPGPFEDSACFEGGCVYGCVEGTVDCGDGTCIPLWQDPDNCGACGNVCDDSTPYCSGGQCWDADCGGRNLDWDNQNCGTCGNVCPPQFGCSFGRCKSVCVDC
jgi:hypothetical protein